MKRIRSKDVTWDLKRFGFTPDKWAAHLPGKTAPKIFCTSLPKAGTHLLERLLCLQKGMYRKWVPTLQGGTLVKHNPEHCIAGIRPGQIVVSHLRFAPGIQQALADHGVKHLMIIRDPRDVLLSAYHFAMKYPTHHAHDRLCQCANLQAALDVMITGDHADPLDLGGRIDGYRQWEPHAHVVRFEDLRGSQQKYVVKSQQDVIRGIFDYLGLPITDNEIAKLLGKLFSAVSPTFRKGVAGEWREAFSKENKQLFKQIAGHQLIAWGYEKDMDW